MNWDSCGPPLTDEAVAKFERELGQKVPDDILWFLRNVVNGGWPGGEDFYVKVELPVELTEVHGMFGIDHPEETFNLLDELQEMPGLLPRMWPIGYDLGGGLFVLMLQGPYIGQVRHLELDDYHESDNPVTHLVAKDIYDFAKILDGPGENPDDYE